MSDSLSQKSDELVKLIRENFVNIKKFKLPSLDDFEAFRTLCLADPSQSSRFVVLSRKSDDYTLTRMALDLNPEDCDDNNKNNDDDDFYDDSIEADDSKSKKEKTLFFYHFTYESDRFDALTMYKMIHDAEYRRKWDGYMIKGFNIAEMTDYTDIGYYSISFPVIKNRYSVAQRMWHRFSDQEFAILNHSVKSPKIARAIYAQQNAEKELKDYVKILSYVSGYYMRSDASSGKTRFTYITCSDIQSVFPSLVMNSILGSKIPALVKKLADNCVAYPQFVLQAKSVFPESVLSGELAKQKDSEAYEEDLKMCKKKLASN